MHIAGLTQRVAEEQTLAPASACAGLAIVHARPVWNRTKLYRDLCSVGLCQSNVLCRGLSQCPVTHRVIAMGQDASRPRSSKSDHASKTSLYCLAHLANAIEKAALTCYVHWIGLVQTADRLNLKLLSVHLLQRPLDVADSISQIGAKSNHCPMHGCRLVEPWRATEAPVIHPRRRCFRCAI